MEPIVTGDAADEILACAVPVIAFIDESIIKGDGRRGGATEQRVCTGHREHGLADTYTPSSEGEH